MKKLSSIPLGKLLLALVILTVLIASISCSSTSTPTPTATTSIPAQSPTLTTATSTATSTGTPAATSTTPPSTATATSTATTSATGLGSVEVLGVWGSTELASFQAMVAPWQQQTGGKMNFTGTRDLTATLITRIQAGNPPDIAILPNPGLMAQFATAGNLKPLNPMVDINAINQQYSSSWINLGTVNNNLYGIFMRAANKSMVWYNPKAFSTNGWNTPTTWTDLISLSNTIVSANKTPKYPWSMGVENGQASGWVGTDWISQIFLSKYGGAAYDQWVAHQISWTDPRIKDAWQLWGSIVNTPNYIAGGATTVLATNFQDASFLPFQTPPPATMYYEGDFVQGFITAQFPSLKATQDYDFFPFPTVPQSASPSVAVSPTTSTSASATPSTSTSVSTTPTTPASSSPTTSTTAVQAAVTGGADLVVAFKDTPTVRSFVSYLATAQAQDIWVKRGGFISVNKQVNLSDYPDPISMKSAQQLLNASLFRFGAGDSMPAAMQTAWWAGILQYLQNPGQLDSILTNLESTAKTAYGK